MLIYKGYPSNGLDPAVVLDPDGRLLPHTLAENGKEIPWSWGPECSPGLRALLERLILDYAQRVGAEEWESGIRQRWVALAVDGIGATLLQASLSDCWELHLSQPGETQMDTDLASCMRMAQLKSEGIILRDSVRLIPPTNTD